MFNSKKLISAVALLIAGGSIACGGGGGGIFGGISRVVGQALRPINGVIESNPIPLGDAVVTLFDFAEDTASSARVARTQEVGRTDANGNYTVDVPGQEIAAIIVNGDTPGGPVRISGLVSPDMENVSKNFDGITDIACEAGISALVDGSVSSKDFTRQRIENLEDAARKFIAANRGVNFFEPSQVSAAAAAVRAASQIGLIQVADDAFTTPASDTGDAQTDNDQSDNNGTTCSGENMFTCNDGTTICPDLVCNNKNECPDGSDESPSTCSEASACCVATAACPSETPTSCGTTCCCCGLNEVCDPTTPANGCIERAAKVSSADLDNPLTKLIEQGVYY